MSNTKIKSIKVQNLFDNMSFEINFEQFSNVSILIAPNGFGKTTIFKLLSFALYPTYETFLEIRNIRFQKFSCTFSDETEIGLASAYCNIRDTSETVWKYLYKQEDEQGNNSHYSYRTVGQRNIHLWFKDSEGNIHTWCLDKILLCNLARYDRDSYGSKNNVSDNNVFILDLMFRDLRKMITTYDVHFIKANRLFTSGISSGGVSEFNTLKSMNDHLEKQLSSAIKEYEKAFITNTNELIALSCKRGTKDRISTFGSNNIDDRWNACVKRLQTYREWGLLPSQYTKNIPDECDYFDDYNEADLQFTSVVLHLLEKSLEPLDYIYEKVSLLLDIVNKRNAITGKIIKFHDRKLVVQQSKSSDKYLDLSVLSSGEMNDLVLFYNLIFNTFENSIVLIDEPEISWHIEWQLTFIDHLQNICNKNGLQALVATHSPSIIGDHVDLIADREERHYAG